MSTSSVAMQSKPQTNACRQRARGVPKEKKLPQSGAGESESSRPKRATASRVFSTTFTHKPSSWASLGDAMPKSIATLKPVLLNVERKRKEEPERWLLNPTP